MTETSAGAAMHILTGTLRDHFGLEPNAARALAALYRAKRPLSSHELAREAGIAVSTISGRAIYHIRQALETEAVDWHCRLYRLTEGGRAEVSRCLLEAAGVLVEAA